MMVIWMLLEVTMEVSFLISKIPDRPQQLALRHLSPIRLGFRLATIIPLLRLEIWMATEILIC